MILVIDGAWRENGGKVLDSMPHRHEVWASHIHPWDSPETVRLKQAKTYVAGLSGTEVADIADGMDYLKRGGPAAAEASEYVAPADPFEAAAERWVAGGAVLTEHAEEFDGLNTVTLALCDQTPQEMRANARSESQLFTFSLLKEAQQYTGDPDDFCYVKFTKYVQGMKPGDVIATSKLIGAKWARHAQARVIDHDEAQAYADRQRQVSGGWMDDPAWVKFRDNYKRLCRAVAA